MIKTTFFGVIAGLLFLQVSTLSLDKNDLDPRAIFVSFPSPRDVRCTKTRFPTYQESPNGQAYFYRCSMGFPTEYRCPDDLVFDMESRLCSSRNKGFFDLDNAVNAQVLDDDYYFYKSADDKAAYQDHRLQDLDEAWLQGLQRDEQEFKPQQDTDFQWFPAYDLTDKIGPNSESSFSNNLEKDAVRDKNEREGTDTEAVDDLFKWFLETEGEEEESDVEPTYWDDDSEKTFNMQQGTGADDEDTFSNWILGSEAEENKAEPNYWDDGSEKTINTRQGIDAGDNEPPSYWILEKEEEDNKVEPSHINIRQGSDADDEEDDDDDDDGDEDEDDMSNWIFETEEVSENIEPDTGIIQVIPQKVSDDEDNLEEDEYDDYSEEYSAEEDSEVGLNTIKEVTDKTVEIQDALEKVLSAVKEPAQIVIQYVNINVNNYGAAATSEEREPRLTEEKSTDEPAGEKAEKKKKGGFSGSTGQKKAEELSAESWSISTVHFSQAISSSLLLLVVVVVVAVYLATRTGVPVPRAGDCEHCALLSDSPEVTKTFYFSGNRIQNI